MFRVPIWITSADSSTADACSTSMSSVTIPTPVFARTRSRIFNPSSPSPWQLYGLVRGLNAPARNSFTPRAARHSALLLLGGVGLHHDEHRRSRGGGAWSGIIPEPPGPLHRHARRRPPPHRRPGRPGPGRRGGVGGRPARRAARDLLRQPAPVLG